ncbi:hypothetical protein JK358_38490 [Nocardia sp. 2]|uniref:Uncharacterized protein n=1 Tax=Nocardia acididurans TaxID=2802282 RepID=A0ABS1MJ53_9NOCA|nr:hypothetical protein [Nocardia acididurans]MBL1080301.1 hypothetical protein [Nocardia acididurans]
MLLLAGATCLIVGAYLQIGANSLEERGALSRSAAARMWAYAFLLIAAPLLILATLQVEMPLIFKVVLCLFHLILLAVLAIVLRRLPRSGRQ